MPTNLDHPITSSGPTPPERTTGHDSQIPPFLKTKEGTQNSHVSDEEQAVRSLDDTIMRPVPIRDTLWTETARVQTEATRPQAPSHRVPTGVLMCIVAVVSFVAGGVTARLSSQMPVLFAEQPAATETVAAYHPTAQEDEEEATQPETTEEQETPESVTAPPSYDTGYDTTDDTTDSDSDDTVWQWNFNDTGDESLTYQPETNEVTIDYDGYSLTVPIGELIGNRTELTDLYSQQDTTERTCRERTWDDGTGYDTEEDRDWYVRHDSPSRTYGWS